MQGRRRRAPDDQGGGEQPCAAASGRYRDGRVRLRIFAGMFSHRADPATAILVGKSGWSRASACRRPTTFRALRYFV